MIRQRDDSTIYMQQPVAYTRPLQHHQYLTDNAGVIDNKREIFQCNDMHEIMLKVDYQVSTRQSEGSASVSFLLQQCIDLDDFSEGHSDYWAVELLDLQTIEPLNYWAFGLSGLQPIELSDYWPFGLLDLRTIGPSNNRTVTVYWRLTAVQFITYVCTQTCDMILQDIS